MNAALNAPAAAPVVVIVGRPNAGKSLLFNRLLRRRCALVHGKPGMTLDYLRERYTPPGGREVWLVDTGGVAGETDEWSDLAAQQMARAEAEGDFFILLTDCKTGLMPGDAELARRLRRRGAPWLLAANKADGGGAADAAASEFFGLGAPAVLPLSAKHGNGIAELERHLAQRFAAAAPTPAEEGAATKEEKAIRVAVVGRPNVGKSTLINRLLGDARLAVSPVPGTTRDSVACEFSLRLKESGAADDAADADVAAATEASESRFVLIDTAGMRRRRADTERDKLSVAAARRALAGADCALLLFDLSAGITRQDKRIAALIGESGCAAAVAANKADLLPPTERAARLRAALAQLAPASALPPSAATLLSALSPRRLPAGRLFAAVAAAVRAANTQLPTARLNAALADIVAARSPAMRGRIRPKLRYAHQGGSRPPCIVIHGSATDRIDDSYKRYLESAFARRFFLAGARVRIVLKSDENPYAPAR